MPIAAKYILISRMDVDAEKEALFNEVYESEHLPSVRKVPGVISATRLQSTPLTLSVGGEVRTVEAAGEPAFATLIEIESPDVLVSDEWAAAVEYGRWPGEVRPYTRNRRHTLHKVTDDGGT
jgi:hypothetical protein